MQPPPTAVYSRTPIARATGAAPDSARRERFRLLPVMLDGVGAARLRVVRVEAELALGPPLPQQVPVAVERDADLLQPLVVAGLEPAVALALEERLLLGDQLVDPAQYLVVVHRSLLPGPRRPSDAGPPPRPSARRSGSPPAARRGCARRSRPTGRTSRCAGAPRPVRPRPAAPAGCRPGPRRTRSGRCPTRRRLSRPSTARRSARSQSGAAPIRCARALRRAARPPAGHPSSRTSPVAVDDPASVQIVRRQLHLDPV